MHSLSDVTARQTKGSAMDGVQPKQFVGQVKSDDHVEIVSEGAPIKPRKPKHRKFIDLQKQPPKPKPPIGE
ncbi:MAG TPA: hypothetical protein VHD95_14200 [Rhizomicrobium sp.]|nr:hypothetical protein [Rhizomicrobium sp.]